MKRAKRKLAQGFKRCVALFTLLLMSLLACGGAMDLRGVYVTARHFEESSRQLENPNRGFYWMYAFRITDEKTDYVSQVAQFNDAFSLVMIEVNLQEYRTGRISAAGLANLDALFHALSESGKQLIVRFLYDWDGENLRVEPAKLETVLTHMEQVGRILQKYEDSIFVLQGLFVGDWAEMHNTRYDSPADLRRLTEKLAGATGARISVRTPAQWRQITKDGTNARLAKRLGLFNDGITGSESDLGTYDMADHEEQRKTREEELDFQDALCRSVPNGGEAVVDNPYNDFENAVDSLERMHITYLNKDYDTAVQEKWAKTTVAGAGCFDGLDGLSYIERRLGYRLFIQDVKLSKSAWRQQVSVEVKLQNAGFAPLYTEPEIAFTLRDESGDLVGRYPTKHNLRELAGGRDTGKTSSVRASLLIGQLPKGTYRLYLDLKDPASGDTILLANVQDREPYGYDLGEIRVLR